MSSSYTSSYNQLIESKRKFPPHPLIYDLLNSPELNILPSPSPPPPPQQHHQQQQQPPPPRMYTPDPFGMSTWQNIDIRAPPDSILSSEGEDLDLEEVHSCHIMVFESEEEDYVDKDEKINEDNDDEENTFIMPRMSMNSQCKNTSSSSSSSNNTMQVASGQATKKNTTTTTTTTSTNSTSTTTVNRNELIIVVRSSRFDEEIGSFNDPLRLLNGWNVIYSFLMGIGLGIGFGFGFGFFY